MIDLPKELQPVDGNPKLDAKAYHGLPGAIVRFLEPHTEADPSAMLAQLLVMFGNVVGRSSYVMAGHSKHYPNEFVVIIGNSAKARKGTSYGVILNTLFKPLFPEWAKTCINSGIVTGYGVVELVKDRDDRENTEKRLLIHESEFGGLLRASKMASNNLSATLRDAWDKDYLQIATKKDPATSTNPHISFIGHITMEELKHELSESDSYNGLANRILWFHSQRSKLLPRGSKFDEKRFEPLRNALHSSIEASQNLAEVELSEEAIEYWEKIYRELSEERYGVLGAVTSRAEVHVLRLALIYALMDLKKEIEPEHLEAALALWNYSDETCQVLFESATGNKTADKILRALRNAAPDGLTRTTILKSVLNKNVRKEQLDQAFDRLLEQNFAYVQEEKNERGRPVQCWYLDDFEPS